MQIGVTLARDNHSALDRIISQLDDRDATSRYREEAADNKPQEPQEKSQSVSSSKDGQTMLSWAPGDPENPYNWSKWRKAFIVFTAMTTIINSTMGSALPSNGIPFMMKEWGVTSAEQKVLPISIFMIGESRTVNSLDLL
jgi:hypothetical protein